MKVIFLVTLSLLVISCSSSDNNDDSSSNTSITLADITGVWDATTTENQQTDETYSIIEENGTVTAYDYQGDSFDNGANCYIKETLSLQDMGDGIFKLTDSENETFNFLAILSGDELTLKDGDTTLILTKTTRLESDFSPLCS